MTEISIAKTVTSLIPVPLVLAAVEPATQVAIVQLASLIVSTLGVVAAAWIAFKQAELRKTVEVLQHNTNAMKDALVASTAKASLSEGFAQGVAQAETKAAIVTAAKATGAAEAASQAHKE